MIRDAIIVGAGPAGLTAGYLLSKAGARALVLESHPSLVGGISRTERYKEFRFDIGGHRFFSKSAKVEALWEEILGPDDFLVRPRSSRIYFRNQFYSYPLRALETLSKLGPVEASRCVLSYAKARVFPPSDTSTFDGWVVSQFGQRLFENFFRTYTEKVWGMPCSEISADWAAQRIKGLSLFTAIWRSLSPPPVGRESAIKTLIESFRYPRHGPGMMWESFAEKFQKQGGELLMGRQVVELEDDGTKGWTISARTADGAVERFRARHVITSAPLRETAAAVRPQLSAAAVREAQGLRYRDFLTVVLMLKGKQLFSDNWIYVHDPSVRVGRVQNFKSWSAQMVPDASMCSYGLEYFCNEGDALWRTSDRQLIELGSAEMERIGLSRARAVIDGCVVRQPKAYPVYDERYKERVASVRAELASRHPTLHLVGRNGMHKYNNQDHSMMTAMLTVENILSGIPRWDVWCVNEDAEYHESGPDDEPAKLASAERA